MTLTIKEMEEVIIEEISDKTLNFGCRIKVPEEKTNWYSIWEYIRWETDKRYCIYSTFATVSRSRMSKEEMLNKKYEIIWHKIYPHHILQWADKNKIYMEMNWIWKISFVFNCLKVEYIQRYLSKDMYWQSDETKRGLVLLIEKVKEWK